MRLRVKSKRAILRTLREKGLEVKVLKNFSLDVRIKDSKKRFGFYYCIPFGKIVNGTLHKNPNEEFVEFLSIKGSNFRKEYLPVWFFNSEEQTKYYILEKS